MNNYELVREHQYLTFNWDISVWKHFRSIYGYNYNIYKLESRIQQIREYKNKHGE